MPDREERIRQRAHEIWEREGWPQGRQDEHWAEAEREIASEERVAAQNESESASTSLAGQALSTEQVEVGGGAATRQNRGDSRRAGEPASGAPSGGRQGSTVQGQVDPRGGGQQAKS